MGRLKYDLQASQYSFPYHYLPQSHDAGYLDMIGSRRLDWALEYLMILDSACDAIGALKGKTVLDVGCGDGRLCDRIRQKFGLEIKYLGVDLVQRAIDFARAFNPGEEFRCCDISEIEGRFELATCIEVLEHVPDAEVTSFLGAIKDRLVPNGHLILSVPTTVRPTHPKHFRHYDRESLATEITNAGLELITMSDVYPVTIVTEWINKLISNSLWTVNHPKLRKFLISLVGRQMGKKLTQPGAHILAVAKKRYSESSKW